MMSLLKTSCSRLQYDVTVYCSAAPILPVPWDVRIEMEPAVVVEMPIQQVEAQTSDIVSEEAGQIRTGREICHK